MCKNGQTMFAPERLQDDPFGPLYCRDDRIYIKDKYRDSRDLHDPFFLDLRSDPDPFVKSGSTIRSDPFTLLKKGSTIRSFPILFDPILVVYT